MTNETEKTSAVSRIFKAIWPIVFIVMQIIAHLGAGIQLGFCIMFFLVICIGGICAAYKVHQVAGFLESIDITGIGLGSQMKRDVDIRLFFIVVLMLIFAWCPLHLCLRLCKGLNQNKIDYIAQYIVGGVMFLCIRVYFIESWEWRNFPEDKTVLYCGLYALYLVILIVICVEINKMNKRLEASVLEIRQLRLVAENNVRQLTQEATTVRTILALLKIRSMADRADRADTTVPYSRVV